MKKYLIIFLLFSAASIIYLSFPFELKKNFISIKDNKFNLNSKDFYPLTLNYIVSMQIDRNGICPCPYIGYNPDTKYLYTTKDSSLMQLKAQMDLIKEMGFNSVRLVGIGETRIDEKKAGELSIVARIENERDTVIVLSQNDNYIKYFNALDELFDVVNKAGLKTIFLTRMSMEYKTTEDHLRRLAAYFKNDTSIMAYDLFNEPLYFDTPERNKRDVFKIVKRWNKIQKMYAPNQLTTIGLEGIREVFEWDPNMLDVDFISYHPYQYEPEQVRNEIYWYGNFTKKPWIIGETAIPADGDSVSYEAQKIFANKTLKQAYNCGASGYSWWQYKDVEWQVFHASFMGVINRKGEMKTTKENIVVEGTQKPITEEFKKFNPAAKKESCLCLPNYYNYSQHNKFRLKGYLADDNNDPIEGGVILAWNQYWSHSYHTITKGDGSFELLSDYPFYHWMASASMYTMVRGDISPDTAKVHTDKIPTINIGKLEIEKLPFID